MGGAFAARRGKATIIAGNCRVLRMEGAATCEAAGFAARRRHCATDRQIAPSFTDRYDVGFDRRRVYFALRPHVRPPTPATWPTTGRAVLTRACATSDNCYSFPRVRLRALPLPSQYGVEHRLPRAYGGPQGMLDRAIIEAIAWPVGLPGPCGCEAQLLWDRPQRRAHSASDRGQYHRARVVGRTRPRPWGSPDLAARIVISSGSPVV